MRDDLAWLDGAAITAGISSGSFSAREVIETTLGRIERYDTTLNAFTAVTAERALARADAVDAARARGAALGPLAGVPFAVKNLIDIAGLPTLAGSKINRERPAASRDATLVVRLEEAGAILVGALNMGEYAYDFTGENIHYGPSRNPHDPARMTGGSSGGSGGAVASALATFALGSDTNGSIRVPASFCGVFGLKPTFGRLSRAGSFPFVSSLDHLGPLARSLGDLAVAYDAMQGHDPEDPVCTARPAEPAIAVLDEGIGDLRIAVAGGYFHQGAFAEALQAVGQAARALGATREVDLPEAARARAAAYVITVAEGAAMHLDRLRDAAESFDPVVRDRLIAGALMPAALVVRAHKFRRWFQAQVLELFQQVDVILAPATPCVAPVIGQQTIMLDGVEHPLRPNIGIFTQPISFIGLPVVALPVPLPSGLPIGVQVIAAPWREDIALRVARALELSGVVRSPRPPEL